MFVGTLAALAHGTALPIMMIIFGDMADLFINDDKLQASLPGIVANLTILCNSLSPAPYNCSRITVDYINENPQKNLK